MRPLASQPAAFIQHPAAVAVRLCTTSDHDSLGMDLVAHGRGGVCVPSALGYQPGTPLQVRVSVDGSELSYRGLVLWRRSRRRAFELGLAFATADAAFRARMIEQLCHIDAYRQRALARGRSLDFEDAAAEWIDRYSGSFPQIGGCGGSIPWRQTQPAVAVG